MIAHVSSAAAVGRKLTMAEAWAATRGKRWRLLGMAVPARTRGRAGRRAWRRDPGRRHRRLRRAARGGGARRASVLGRDPARGATLWFWVRVRALAVPDADARAGRDLRRARPRRPAHPPPVLAAARPAAPGGPGRRRRGRHPAAAVQHRRRGLPDQLRRHRLRPPDLPPADRGRHGHLLGGAPALLGRGQRAALHRPAHPQGGVRRRAARRGPGSCPPDARARSAPATLRRRGSPSAARGAPARRVPPPAPAAAPPRLALAPASRAASARRPGTCWVTDARDHAGRGAAARRSGWSCSRGSVATAGTRAGATAGAPRRPARRPASCGAGPRRRSRTAATPTRSWTASGRWPCARSSAAGSTTSPAPPPTRSRRTLATSYPGQGERVGRSADLFDATLYGDRPASRDDARGLLELDDALAGAAMRWLRAAPLAAPGRRGAVVAVVLLGLARPRRPRRTPRALDPGNPDGDGAQAVARVLDDQGVDVDVVRSRRRARRGRADASTTIVVTSADRPRPLDHPAAAATTRARPRSSWSRPARSSSRELGVGTFPVTTDAARRRSPPAARRTTGWRCR